MSRTAAAAMLRLRATASIARTCRRSLLQQHQNSRSLFSASALSSSKLDKLLPQVEDFPSRHIGPRRHDAKDMLRVLGYNVGIHAYNGILFDGYLSHVRVHATYSNIFCSLWTNSRNLFQHLVFGRTHGRRRSSQHQAGQDYAPGESIQ